MPTVLRKNGFRVFLWSLENNEPPHVHVEKAGGYGKWWLNPLRSAGHRGFTIAQLRAIESILREHEQIISDQWRNHFEPRR